MLIAENLEVSEKHKYKKINYMITGKSDFF